MSEQNNPTTIFQNQQAGSVPVPSTMPTQVNSGVVLPSPAVNDDWQSIEDEKPEIKTPMSIADVPAEPLEFQEPFQQNQPESDPMTVTVNDSQNNLINNNQMATSERPETPKKATEPSLDAMISEVKPSTVGMMVGAVLGLVIGLIVSSAIGNNFIGGFGFVLGCGAGYGLGYMIERSGR